MLTAVDGLDQLHDLVGQAEKQLQGLFHVVPARTLAAFLCHCGILPACSPGDLPPGWCRVGDPARARIIVPARHSGPPEWHRHATFLKPVHKRHWGHGTRHDRSLPERYLSSLPAVFPFGPGPGARSRGRVHQYAVMASGSADPLDQVPFWGVAAQRFGLCLAANQARRSVHRAAGVFRMARPARRLSI